MKKACVYILLPFFLLNGTLGELFKLPALYNHFIEHHRIDNDIDLVDFLSMHYIGDDLNANDQDRDMELPFKKISDNNAFQIAFTAFTKLTFEKKQLFPPRKALLPDSQDFNLTDPALSNLFKPPIS